MGDTFSDRVMWHWWTVVATFVSLPFLSSFAAGMTMKYQIYEEDALSTVIGNLATDMSLNSSDGSRINFRMMKQFNASFIRLHEKDGQLTIGERIDREKICKHMIQCIITFDVGCISNEQFKLIHIEVEVKDINDHAPEFPRKEFTLEISENTPLRTRFPMDVAMDEDVGSNYIQSYQISVNDYFTSDMLSRADGVKYAELVLMKELDRETHASYVLELVVTDGGNPSRSSTTKINIKVKDLNDNSPVFDQSSFLVDILEDAPVGFLLLDLNAVDPDDGLNGEVVYGFGNQVPSDVRDHFSVDRKSGQLKLKTPLDFENKNIYEFNIQASDLGPNSSPSICKVVVQVQDVNDNTPEITITPMTSVTAGIAYITEAAAKESFVALISTVDQDSGANGQIHCSLYGHNHFKLQQAYGDSFMIVTTSPLDREKIAEYNLTVVAEDLGSPPFRTIKQYTIRLSDENDNSPVFSKPVYEVSLMENNAPGAYITAVVAKDFDLGQNSKISYNLVNTYIMGSSVLNFVTLDPTTGSLFALRSFNYEVLKQLQLHIQARDGGLPQLQGSAIINLKITDQNDNAPFITQPVLNNNSADVLVPKEVPSGYVITKIHAKDADEGVNAELSFSISEGVTSVFSINRSTGEIFLNHQLKYEICENTRIIVTVSDNGRPSLTTTVTINLNITAVFLHSDGNIFWQRTDMETQDGDHSVIIIVLLAGSCILLLSAIVLITSTCTKQKLKNQSDSNSGIKGGGIYNKPIIPNHRPMFSGLIQTGSDISCHEDGMCVCELEDKSHCDKPEGYSTIPGYGKDAVRQIKNEKSTSYATISAQEPEFSGKKCRNEDSDGNDTDSGLGACTSECKILGHSDHCWTPEARQMNSGLPHSLAKTGSLAQETFRREYNYQTHIPKTLGLQSVCKKVLHMEHEYITIVDSPSTSHNKSINNN